VHADLSAAEGPLSDVELDVLFADLGEARGLALAVSGGADSVALMLVASRWLETRAGPPAHVLTVDHALRPEGRREAEEVAHWAGRLGFAATILVREGGRGPGNLQAAVRAARYDLLADAARRLGLSHVLTAHHQDDQAETFLLRLARGSGLQGLTGMARQTRLGPGLLLARPLLGVPKSRLLATCRARGHPWIEDPSNADERFARARLRKLMPALAAQGLTARRLAATASRLARAQEAVEASVEALLSSALRPDARGAAELALGPLARAPDEVALRALTRALQAVGGAHYPRGSSGWTRCFRSCGLRSARR